MDEYINLLKTHDWFYYMSDDHRAWKAGEEKHNRILALAKEHDPQCIIYNQYKRK